MNCNICNKNIKNYIALGLHLKKDHNMTSKDYYDAFIRKENEGKCQLCGKETSFQGIRLGYLSYCSNKCSNNCPKTIQKREQTCLQYYGTKNPYQSKEIKEKIKKHNLETYGVEYNLQRKETILQSKYTKLQKYGSETYNNMAKQRQTCLKKFGVDHYSKTKEFKESIKDVDVFGSKSKKNLETHFKNVQLQKQQGYITVQDAFSKYGQSWYKNRIVPIIYKDHTGYISLEDEQIIKQYYLDNNGHSSQIENEILNIIKSYYFGQIIHGDNKIIAPLELDFYLPDLKLAIEFNGTYWHSIKFKDINYHYDKSMLCLQKGIRLIHFYEFESLDYIKDFLYKLFNNKEIPTNDFNKYSPNTLDVVFSGPQLLQDNVYGSGIFTLN